MVWWVEIVSLHFFTLLLLQMLLVLWTFVCCEHIYSRTTHTISIIFARYTIQSCIFLGLCLVFSISHHRFTWYILFAYSSLCLKIFQYISFGPCAHLFQTNKKKINVILFRFFSSLQKKFCVFFSSLSPGYICCSFFIRSSSLSRIFIHMRIKIYICFACSYITTPKCIPKTEKCQLVCLQRTLFIYTHWLCTGRIMLTIYVCKFSIHITSRYCTYAYVLSRWKYAEQLVYESKKKKKSKRNMQWILLFVQSAFSLCNMELSRIGESQRYQHLFASILYLFRQHGQHDMFIFPLTRLSP